MNCIQNKIYFALLASVFLALLLPVQGASEMKTLPEHRIKAAFIVKFASFIQWPENKARSTGDKSIRIGVWGDGLMYGALKSLSKEMSDNRKIEVIRVSSENEIAALDILFIGKGEEAEVARVLKHSRGKGVLTVGDAAGFTPLGGMIRFFLASQKVRFEISPKAAREEGIVISSKLLKLSQIYHG